jgi:hypothetical protein
MDLLDIIVFFLLGYIIGQLVFAYKIAKEVSKLAHGITFLKPSANQPTIAMLKTECVGDTILLYDLHNYFICQGRSLEELAKLSKEYKNINNAAVLHNDVVVTFKDGEVIAD